ncbi:hypothetical protein Sste5346_009531 [Sporothrix stenoceras]|uniref:SET domain-containing protein n=1 Tax=Sporothrix stenoceras TaxID=5173 RepID=A0ABR3YKU6_9PEZI
MPLFERIIRAGLAKANGEPVKRSKEAELADKHDREALAKKARNAAEEFIREAENGDDSTSDDGSALGTNKFKATATSSTLLSSSSSFPAASGASDEDDEDESSASSPSSLSPPTAPLWAGNSDNDKIVYAPDSDYESDGSETSWAQLRADECVRSEVSRSHGMLSGLGRAELLQERSAGLVAGGDLTNKRRLRNGRTLHHQREHVPPKPCVVEIEYPAGDPSAADGFRLWGFKEGKRVYKLDSPYLAVLRANLVKTAVGLCYIDIAAECPPQIVTVPTPAAIVSPTDQSSLPAPGAASATSAKPPVEPAADLATFETVTTATTDKTETTSSAAAAHSAQPAVESSKSAASVSASDKSAQSTTAAVSKAVPPSLAPPTLEVNGMFAIRPSALGGLGCFALKDISRGDHLLVERPLIRTNMLHLQEEIDRLTPDQRAQFDSLTGYHPDPRVSRDAQIWTANTFVTGELEGLFVVASRFNHACTESPAQNVGYRYDRQLGVLTMTAVGRIKKGTELLISYGKSRRMLHERFGFWCLCSGCGGDMYGDEDPASVQERLTEEMYKRIWS